MSERKGAVLWWKLWYRFGNKLNLGNWILLGRLV